MQSMADARERLEKVHDLLIEQTLAALESGEATVAERQIALQLLKQSGVSAPLNPTGSIRAGLAGKLDFSTLNGKIRPLRPIAQDDSSASA